MLVDFIKWEIRRCRLWRASRTYWRNL